MKPFFCGLIILLFFSFSGEASVCPALSLSSLKTIAINGSESSNLCLKKESELSSSEKNLLEQIRGLHFKVAELFGKEPTALFPAPFALEVSESLLGWLPSLASRNGIFMTVYPGSGFKINTGVYLHELAHMISYMPGSHFPEQVRDLHRAKFFAEAFADLLALTLNDAVITPEEKSSCLDRLRFVGTHQTYRYPIEYFQNFTERRILKCCESILRELASSQEKILCEEVSQWGFEPSKEIDDHQIGLPFLSFLKNFSHQNGQDLRNIFKKLFVQKTKALITHTCSNGKTISLVTLSSLVTEFRDALSEQEKELFDRLGKKHHIEEGLRYNEVELGKNLAKECL